MFVLDWQKDSLLLARGEIKAGRVSLEALSHQEFSQSAEASDSGPKGALRRAASKLNAKGSLTVLAARDLVELRTLQVPKIDPHDLPDMIRFQAQRQFTNMTDGWVVDFVMLPQTPEQEMQTALVAAISPNQLSEIEAACSAHGFQVERVLLRPLEVARLAARSGQISADGCSMVVCVSQSTADILLLRNGQTVQIRSTRLPTEPDQRAAILQGEVRRSLMAGASEMEGSKLESVLLIASATVGDALVETLHQVFQSAISRLLPEELLGSGSTDASHRELADTSGFRLAGIGGAILASSDRHLFIDFKHPKKRPPKKKNTRTLILSAAAVATILLIAVGWYFNRIGQLNAEYENYMTELNTKSEVAKSAENRIAELRAIEQFLSASPNWLDELTYIAERMPGAGHIKLENPSFAISRDGEGIISLTVKADKATSIAAFEDSIRGPNHVVSGTGASQLLSPQGSYQWEGLSTIRAIGRGWDVSESKVATRVKNAQDKVTEDKANEDKANEDKVNEDKANEDKAGVTTPGAAEVESSDLLPPDNHVDGGENDAT